VEKALKGLQTSFNIKKEQDDEEFAELSKTLNNNSIIKVNAEKNLELAKSAQEDLKKGEPWLLEKKSALEKTIGRIDKSMGKLVVEHNDYQKIVADADKKITDYETVINDVNTDAKKRENAEAAKDEEEQKIRLARSAQKSIEREKASLIDEREKSSKELENTEKSIHDPEKSKKEFKKIVDESSKEIDDAKVAIDAAKKEIIAPEQAIANATEVIDLITALLDDSDLSVEEKEAKMNAVGGQFYASTHSVLLGDHHLRNVVQAHMPGLAAQPVLTASNGNVPVGAALNTPAARTWANAWGYDGKTSMRQGESLQHKGSGIAVGADVRVADNVAAGALLAFEDGKVSNDKTLHAHTQLKSYSVGSYVSAQAGAVTLTGGLLYSKLDFDATRDMEKLAAGTGEAKASYKGHKTQAFAEVARAFELGEAGTVSPYLNLTQTWLHTDAVKEKGSALLPLEAKAQNTSALQSTLGVRTRVRLPVATPVSLSANLGWAHTFAKSVKASTRIVTAAGVVGDEMSMKGQAVAKDRVLVGVGVEAQVAKHATLALAYDGQFGSKYHDHAGSVQFKLRF